MAAPSRPKQSPQTKTRILIAALVLVVAVLAAVLILTLSAQRSPYTNRIAAVASVPATDDESKRALRYDLSNATEAEAYFQRLLNSEYIGLRGDAPQPAELMDGYWHLREENGDGTELSAVFTPEGLITSLAIGTNLDGEMKNSKKPYADNSVYEYIRAFTYEYLPDIAIISGRAVADQYNEQGRFITFQTATRATEPAHEFIVQVDPQIRIVGFRLLTDEIKAFTRISRKAQPEADPAAAPAATPEASYPGQGQVVQLARDALTKLLDIPAAEVADYIVVDVSRYTGLDKSWYGYVPTSPYWLVSFRMPTSDDRIYSDYDLILDAATGEVVKLFDPSNNSNGRLTSLFG